MIVKRFTAHQISLEKWLCHLCAYKSITISFTATFKKKNLEVLSTCSLPEYLYYTYHNAIQTPNTKDF